MKAEKRPYLNRFTSLPCTLDILMRRHITLLEPERWPDRNDAHYLQHYRDAKGLSTLVAICFSTTSETFHHWRVFSDGVSGVCIEFDKEMLLESIAGEKGFNCRDVTYSWISEVERNRPPIDSLPFLKRKVFADEHEFRIIFESNTLVSSTFELPIDLDAVQKVTLSPWMPDSVAKSVRKLIKSIEGCSKLQVNRSTLIDSQRWKNAVIRKK